MQPPTISEPGIPALAELHAICNLDHLIRTLESNWKAAPAPALTRASHDAGERRAAPRYPSATLSTDWKITIPGGPRIVTVDVSSTGVLVETPGRLCPGRLVNLIVHDRSHRRGLKATVVRSWIAALRPEAVYRTALRFHEPLALDDRR